MNLTTTIQAINTLLQAEFPTLQTNGIAKQYIREDNEQYYGVYIGAGKIVPVMPDTSKQHISFFTIENMTLKENAQDYSIAEMKFWWWGQLHRIDPTRDYDYTDHIIAKISDILKRKGGYNMQVDFEAEKWLDFQANKQLYMLPFSYFTINFSLQFNNCIIFT